MEMLPAASQAEFGRFVRGAIDRAHTTVKTDGWSGYGDLRQHGVEHEAVVQADPPRAAGTAPPVGSTRSGGGNRIGRPTGFSRSF